MSIITARTANIHSAIRGHKSCTLDGRVYSVCSNRLSTTSELSIACTVARDGLLNISYLRFSIATDLDVSSAAICRFGTVLLLAIPSVDRPLEFFTFCPESSQLKEIRGPTIASRWHFSMIEVSPNIILLCGGDFVRKCYLLDFAKKTLSETDRLPFTASSMTLVILSSELVAAPTCAVAGQFPTNRCLFYSIPTGKWHIQILPIPEHIHYGVVVLADQLLLLLTPRAQQKGLLEFRGYTYNHRTNVVYRMERPDFPSYCDPVVFVNSGRLYVVGGLQDGRISSNVHDITLAAFVTCFKNTELRSLLKEEFGA
ncbi:Hypothetical protein GLP15_4956 [Giardia lamblia P15]|uniref:Kelch motif-containing protein n=1 Tax=Giardia intestinalis (strain P15) TaxID=658858 RepID=E1F0T9_GIAIA|nr:Hypothetical protein GLP15_4956 [Giardia lamblia P15]